MSDLDTLNGIAEATEADDMPRVVDTFLHPVFGKVDIVEPVLGSEDGNRRGYLWHAVAGDYVLTPTRRGYADPDRFVPGTFDLRAGGRLLAYSSVSPRAAIRNALRIKK